MRDIHTVKQLVGAYFTHIGASFGEVSPGIYRAELSKQAAAELEGSPWLLWSNTGPTDNSHITYYFTFDPELFDPDQSTELLTPGSHRFSQILESIRRMTRAFRAWLPAYECVEKMSWTPRHVFYRPFYLFILRLQFQGQTATRMPYAVAVDRVDGIALTQLGSVLPRLPLKSGQPPQVEGSSMEPPSINHELGFALAFDELLQQLERENPSWAHQTRDQLELEKRRLIQFFAQREQDGDDVAEERDRRLHEIDEMMPRVRVDIQSTGDVYLPLTHRDEGTLHHLAFELF